MAFLGSSKSAKNTTNVDNSARDNRVAAQDSTVLSSGGGGLTNQAGAIVAGDRSSISVSTSDKGSFQLASDIADRAFATVAAGNSAVTSIAGQTSDTVAKLAQGTPIGTDWKRLVLPLAALAAVVGFLFLRKRKAT